MASEAWKEVNKVVNEVASILNHHFEDNGPVMDSAAGCLGRILSSRSLPVDAIPLTSTLASMLTALPLQYDEDEVFPVARGVAALALKGERGWEALRMNSNKSAEAIEEALVLHTDRTQTVRWILSEQNEQKLSRY